LPLGLWVAPSHGCILDHRLSEAIASTCREISDKVHYTRVVVVHTTWPSIKQTMLCFARYAEFEIFVMQSLFTNILKRVVSHQINEVLLQFQNITWIYALVPKKTFVQVDNFGTSMPIPISRIK
jgi:hypothetical protein